MARDKVALRGYGDVRLRLEVKLGSVGVAEGFFEGKPRVGVCSAPSLSKQELQLLHTRSSK